MKLLASLLFISSFAVAFGQTSTAPTEPVVTKHTINFHGSPLAYTATAGTMPIRNDDGEIEGRLFYVAYTRDGEDPARRPVTISYNGGPGSSSMWLHMGCLG